VIISSICAVECNIHCLGGRFEVHVAVATLGENLLENLIFGSGILDDAAAISACMIITIFRLGQPLLALCMKLLHKFRIKNTEM